MAKRKRSKRRNKIIKPKHNWELKDVIFSLIYVAFTVGAFALILLGDIRGDLWPDILLATISISLSAYLATLQVLSTKAKVVIITVSAFLCVHTAYKAIEKYKKEQELAKTREYYYQSQERAELYGRGLSDQEIWKYDKDPLLRHTLVEADQNRQRGEFQIAINKYKSCLEHPNISIESRHWTYGNIAKCYESLGKIDLAEKHWNLALKVAQKIDDRMVKTWFVGRSYAGLGTMYYASQKYDQALDYYQKSLQVYQNGGAITGTAAGLYNIALTYSVTNRFEQALEAYQRCIEFAEKHNEKGIVANSLCNVGIVLLNSKRGTYEQIMNYCDRSLNLALAIRDQSCIVRVANFAAHLSFDNKEFIKSIEYNKKFIEFSSNKFTTEVGIAMAIVAQTYFFTGKYQLALSYYQQARNVFLKIGNNEFYVESLEHAGLTCTFMGRTSDALLY